MANVPSHNGEPGLPPPTTFSQYKRRRGHESKEGGRSNSRFVQLAGESGRRGFHPWMFLRISFRSASRASLVCNVLWPVVPAALAVRCKSDVEDRIYLEAGDVLTLWS